LPAVFDLLRVVTLRADIAPLDRLQPELVGNFLGPRQAMERLVRREVWRVHPLLNFSLMTFRTLIGPNNLGGITRRRTCRWLGAERRRGAITGEYEANEGRAIHLLLSIKHKCTGRHADACQAVASGNLNPRLFDG